MSSCRISWRLTYSMVHGSIHTLCINGKNFGGDGWREDRLEVHIQCYSPTGQTLLSNTSESFKNIVPGPSMVCTPPLEYVTETITRVTGLHPTYSWVNKLYFVLKYKSFQREFVIAYSGDGHLLTALLTGATEAGTGICSVCLRTAPCRGQGWWQMWP